MLKNSIKNQYKVKEKKNTTLSFHLQNTRQHTYNLRTIRYTVLGKLNRPCRTHSCIHVYINTYIPSMEIKTYIIEIDMKCIFCLTSSYI